jgi:hypothetical protein
MTFSEAMELVSREYDRECYRARNDAAFNTLITETIGGEYGEIDKELPDYVSDIARGHGVRAGTILPDYVYQTARMCFRLGMRCQRKLDRPGEPTSIFWRSDQKAI